MLLLLLLLLLAAAAVVSGQGGLQACYSGSVQPGREAAAIGSPAVPSGRKQRVSQSGGGIGHCRRKAVLRRTGQKNVGPE